MATLIDWDEHLRNLQEKEREGFFTCECCGMTLQNREEYEEHVDRHHESDSTI
jgi:uncharacterized C2H2 Zn-finger protein